MTSIFAYTLLSNKYVETYEWVLATLTMSMRDKIPTSVLTDVDKTMRKAIRKMIPGARHRLCNLLFA